MPLAFNKLLNKNTASSPPFRPSANVILFFSINDFLKILDVNQESFNRSSLSYVELNLILCNVLLVIKLWILCFFIENSSFDWSRIFTNESNRITSLFFSSFTVNNPPTISTFSS